MKSKTSSSKGAANKQAGGSGKTAQAEISRVDGAVPLNLQGLTGGVVQSIRCTADTVRSQNLEIRFSDGTFLFVEPVLELRFKVRILRMNNGDVETIQDLGVLQTA